MVVPIVPDCPERCEKNKKSGIFLVLLDRWFIFAAILLNRFSPMISYAPISLGVMMEILEQTQT